MKEMLHMFITLLQTLLPANVWTVNSSNNQLIFTKPVKIYQCITWKPQNN